ncbi:MAG: hypothetical protein A2W19_17310 [Spirochaetes bacterium RBG_16_49_21]|nr:MAG: hypothetical protein A2W19_17310 [Spirochaetes bacterium RBG_16_49_21]
MSCGRLLFFMLVILVNSCGYFSITKRDDMSESGSGDAARSGVYNSSVIMGDISDGSGIERATSVIAYPLSYAGGSLTDYVILDRPGPFMLYVPAGRYHIFSVSDFNDNGIFEQDEVSGVYGRPDAVSVEEGDVKQIIVTADPSARERIKFPVRIRIKDDARESPHQTANGGIIKIYDERFSLENATAGWWSPTLFMKAFGAHIYLTRQFDRRKIPVLFVHGAQGSPHNWAYFYFRLDREKYQPWFYYYPSGIRLPLASRLLYESLLELKKKYDFKAICITAHSMGGLIVRHLLTRYDLRGHGIETVLFVSLASPWTGFESADPKSIFPIKKLPSWIDVASTSTFIKRTMQARLPSSVSYYLFYGRDDSLARGAALDERAYSGAKGKYGFDVDHDTILKDRTVFRQFKVLLSKDM